MVGGRLGCSGVAGRDCGVTPGNWSIGLPPGPARCRRYPWIRQLRVCGVAIGGVKCAIARPVLPSVIGRAVVEAYTMHRRPCQPLAQRFPPRNVLVEALEVSACWLVLILI